MDLQPIKDALNHRSLTQAEQWALVAEVERYQALVDAASRVVQSVPSRSDAMEALKQALLDVT